MYDYYLILLKRKKKFVIMGYIKRIVLSLERKMLGD